MPRFISRRTKRIRTRRYAKKMDPEVWARRYTQVGPKARVEWISQVPRFVETESLTLKQAREAGVPEEKLVYWLGSGKSIQAVAQETGGKTAEQEVTLRELERTWRELPPAQVETIMERAREIGEGVCTLPALVQATREIAPEQMQLTEVILKPAEEWGEQLREDTEEGMEMPAMVDMGSTEWHRTYQEYYEWLRMDISRWDLSMVGE